MLQFCDRFESKKVISLAAKSSLDGPPSITLASFAAKRSSNWLYTVSLSFLCTSSSSRVPQIVSFTFMGGSFVQLKDLSGLDERLVGFGFGPTAMNGAGAPKVGGGGGPPIPGGGGGGGPPIPGGGGGGGPPIPGGGGAVWRVGDEIVG